MGRLRFYLSMWRLGLYSLSSDERFYGGMGIWGHGDMGRLRFYLSMCRLGLYSLSSDGFVALGTGWLESK